MKESPLLCRISFKILILRFAETYIDCRNVTTGSAFGMELIITFLVVLSFFALMNPEDKSVEGVKVSTLHFGGVIALVHLIAVGKYSYFVCNNYLTYCTV